MSDSLYRDVTEMFSVNIEKYRRDQRIDDEFRVIDDCAKIRPLQIIIRCTERRVNWNKIYEHGGANARNAARVKDCVRATAKRRVSRAVRDVEQSTTGRGNESKSAMVQTSK